MQSRLKFILPAVVALSVATGADAQNVNRAAPGQEASVETARAVTAERLRSDQLRAVLQTERRPGFIAIAQPPAPTPDGPPRPRAPRLYPIDWAQVIADAREQQTGPFANQSFTAGPNQGPRLPTPLNPDRAGLAANSRLPILLPPLELLDMGETPPFFLFPAENFYTASFTGEGFLVEIFGTRVAHAEPPTPLSARRLRVRDGEGFQATRTEYGLELNFNRYGAAYSITIECDDPDGDSHCFDEAYVRGLARNLRYSAGSSGEE
jgi:hypothetical protein